MLRSVAPLPRLGHHATPHCCSKRTVHHAARRRASISTGAASGSSPAPSAHPSTSSVTIALATAGALTHPAVSAAIQSASHLFHQERPVQEQQAAMSKLQQQLSGSVAGLSPQQQAMALLLCSGAMQATDAAASVLAESVQDLSAEGGVAMASAAKAAADAGCNPLLGCSSSIAAVRLAMVMQQHVGKNEADIASDPNMHNIYKERLEQLGPQQVWELAQESIHLHYHGAERRADNGEKRECNGILLRLLSKKGRAHDKQQLPSLWPDGQPPIKLRPYQQACVDHLVGHDGNIMVVAPTGSGKTAIAAEVAKQLVASNPAAKVVMVVPTLALCGQQSVALGQYCRCAVGDFNSNNPLTAEEWPQALQDHSMMVFTAGALANVLEKRPEALHEVDLLVLDEVHNARGESPYTRILDIRTALARNGAQLPRVVGLTASPATANTRDGTSEAIQQLLDMFAAQVYWVEEKALARKQVIGIPESKVAYAATRATDRAGWGSLLGALLGALHATHTAATAAEAAAGDPRLQVLYSDLATATEWQAAPGGALDMDMLMNSTNSQNKQTLMAVVWEAVSGMLAAVSAYNTPQTPGAAEAVAPLPQEVRRCVLLCQGLRSALMLLDDAGLEASIRHMALVLYDALRPDVTPAAIPMTSASSNSNTSMDMSAAPAADCGWPLSAQQLAQQLLEGSLLGDPAVVAAAHQCNAPGAGFPRLEQLVEELARHQGRSDFHAIVFVHQRLVAPWVAEQLRHAPELSFLDDVRVVWGTANTSAGGAAALLGGTKPPGVAGMNMPQQLLELERFKDSGNRVLVATPAIEEGIDVPLCSLVVRYNPAATGQQLTQGKGRARDLASTYVTLLDDPSKDWGCSSMALDQHQLHERSIVQEIHMKEVAQQLAA